MKKRSLTFPKGKSLTQAIQKAKKESLKLLEDQGLAAKKIQCPIDASKFLTNWAK